MPRLLREVDPLKITSAISPPRSDLADCSPRIHRTASTTLLLPDPFGPTTAVMPGAKSNRVLSANDLNPTSSRRVSIDRPHNAGVRAQNRLAAAPAGPRASAVRTPLNRSGTRTR